MTAETDREMAERCIRELFAMKDRMPSDLGDDLLAVLTPAFSATRAAGREEAAKVLNKLATGSDTHDSILREAATAIRALKDQTP